MKLSLLNYRTRNMLLYFSCYNYVVACLKAHKLPMPSLFCESNYSPDFISRFSD